MRTFSYLLRGLLVAASSLLGCSGEQPAPWTSMAGASSGGGALGGVAGASNGGTGGVSNAAGAPSAGTASDAGGTGGSPTAGGSPGGGGSGGMAENGGSAGSAMGNGGVGDAGGTSGAGGGNRTATIVVRGQGTPTAGDQIMIGRIKAHGFAEVVVVSDAAVTAQSVNGSHLVVISSSAESGPLQDKLKDIPIPVLCVEDAEFTKMGMASAGDHTAGISDVAIVGGPLVGTASGTLSISSKPGELGWGTPAASALKGATLPGNQDRLVVFGYEKGAQMTSMAAPARRAGFAIREQLAANLNADGLKLFDSILEWVTQ
jgi:hypothetical protein